METENNSASVGDSNSHAFSAHVRTRSRETRHGTQWSQPYGIQYAIFKVGLHIRMRHAYGLQVQPLSKIELVPFRRIRMYQSITSTISLEDENDSKCDPYLNRLRRNFLMVRWGVGMVIEKTKC